MACFQVHLRAPQALLLTVTDRETHTPADIWEHSWTAVCMCMRMCGWESRELFFFFLFVSDCEGTKEVQV